MKRIIALALACALLPACSKEKPKEDPVVKQETPKKEIKKKAPKKAPVRVAALAPDEPRTKLGDFPSFVDLEEEADRTVAVENLEAELDRLEAEIVGETE